MEGQEYVMTWGDSDGGRERERYAIDQTWMMGIFLNNRLEIGDMEVSGGRWWCSTLETGRKTPSTPSSPSRLVPQIFSENQTLPLTLLTCLWPNCLMVVFITFNDEHDVSSQAGCCLYGCSTDGIASHHTWARWWDNMFFLWSVIISEQSV